MSQFSSVAQLCLTLCDPMDCSTPGLPVHHQLLELTQTDVYWVGDAIQPSHVYYGPSALRVLFSLVLTKILYGVDWWGSIFISPSSGGNWDSEMSGNQSKVV